MRGGCGLVGFVVVFCESGRWVEGAELRLLAATATGANAYGNESVGFSFLFCLPDIIGEEFEIGIWTGTGTETGWMGVIGQTCGYACGFTRGASGRTQFFFSGFLGLRRVDREAS